MDTQVEEQEKIERQGLWQRIRAWGQQVATRFRAAEPEEPSIEPPEAIQEAEPDEERLPEEVETQANAEDQEKTEETSIEPPEAVQKAEPEGLWQRIRAWGQQVATRFRAAPDEEQLPGKIEAQVNADDQEKTEETSIESPEAVQEAEPDEERLPEEVEAQANAEDQEKIGETSIEPPEAIQKAEPDEERLPEEVEAQANAEDQEKIGETSIEPPEAIQKAEPDEERLPEEVEAQANAEDQEKIGETSIEPPEAIQEAEPDEERLPEEVEAQEPINAIELDIEKEQLLEEEKITPKIQADIQSEKVLGENKIKPDKVFTASQEDISSTVPAEIEKQYLRVGDKFYHSKNHDLLAFEDKGNKLETKSNSEAIAKSMVRIAESRGWDEIKVSGSEIFRKEVWLEAASRGMNVKGYTPSEKDKAILAKRLSETEANKVEETKTNKVEKDNKPFRGRENEDAKEMKKEAEAKADTPNKRMAKSFANDPLNEAVQKHPELAGAAAVLTAIDKKAEADGMNEQQRSIIMARVRQNVANSIERGELPEVKIKKQVEVTRQHQEDMEHTR